ncbi:efflux RND transporter periplasmic adaptor subunit [Rhodoblastus acidophilus]|uniref:Efflux RND transporter periplasmic adaptor subunit n=1 Tax=Candidatus Rhodoblastus alkanivorans TaxID=2954117 RepID=A0ABS9ZAU3_9HYPH|nr:efflux RND transporter periplasmic adaptor subunit [Candidatus Rhodoblastus alkanivorans]MCI4679344.1 efflux RND transporter periplasmic adaptor subunit [Candidatus Rhodoblastus alkanivorans]MCI4684820.1 efflux RND transporter periplasmic adaptor subunit [Candidatus Rhodoblastus alkanivorans]MDI4642144.1 efflux RND transporter periplasmic adaptor subunit [Rhodoblastus acidophilus]
MNEAWTNPPEGSDPSHRAAGKQNDLGCSWRPPDAGACERKEAERRSGQRRRFGLLVGLALAVGLGWGFWQNRSARLAAEEAKAQFRDVIPLVRVADVKPGASVLSVNLPGTTLAFANADIYARANGYVAKRNVDIGDHVKAGDVLAVLAAPELDHQIAQAEAAIAQAKATIRRNDANAKLAALTNARSAKLVKQGWTTAQQGDIDRLTAEAQKAALGASEANGAALTDALRVLKQERDYLTVVAPFDGVITQRGVDVGSLIQNGATLLFNLQKTDVIRVQVNVPQDQAFGLGPGDDVAVRVPELPDHVFPGKVTRVAGALQQGTRTLLTEADVPNPDGLLKAGAYCEVELKIPRKTNALLVPAEALIFNREGTRVAVVDDGVARLRKIRVTRDFGTAIEASTGLTSGDKVILNPAAGLADGQKVEIAARGK